jgi:predicted negative regulator of RcsB-dependent stress response
VVIVVCLGIVGHNGWNWWQRQQSTQAAAMLEAAEGAARSGDLAALERSSTDLKTQFSGTAQAQQALLLAARVQQEQGKADAAAAALRWVSEQGSDEGLQAIARLRLASLLVDQKAYDEALKVLGAAAPASFAALVADRRGDVLMLKGQKDEARAEYSRAFKAMDSTNEYRRLVEVKLNALGVDPVSAPGPRS